MRVEWEERLALGGLIIGLVAAGIFVLVGQREAAYWAVAAGATTFYGFGCFGVWWRDDPPPAERAERRKSWFVHMYWSRVEHRRGGAGTGELLFP